MTNRCAYDGAMFTILFIVLALLEVLPGAKPEAVELALARALSASGRGREIRLAARLTLEDVGLSIGADAASVLRWERGTVRPRRDAAVRWARLMADLAKANGQAA